jgi:hypothetical protein
MLKKILIGIFVLILLIVGGGYYLGSNLDSIVQTAIEKYGSAATQTAVKLEKVKIVLASGEAALAGLSVGSPSGFAADKALYLGKIAIKLDTNSLSGTGPIVVQNISIEKPQITYEVNNSGETNLQVLARNAQTYAASLSGGGKGKAQTSDAADKKQPSRKIIISNLTISDGQIAISQAALKGKQLSANLPTIHLTNIGKNEGGSTPSAVAQKILESITNSASKVARAALTKELGSELKKAGEGIVGGAVEDTGIQLKGLLGK